MLLGSGLVLVFPSGQPQVAVQFETWILGSIAALRTDWLTPVMRALGAVGTGWSITILGWGMLALLIIFRRWRHLFTFFVAACSSRRMLSTF